MTLEAQYFCGWMNGIGLPVPFYDMDVTTAATLLQIQTEIMDELEDAVADAKEKGPLH